MTSDELQFAWHPVSRFFPFSGFRLSQEWPIGRISLPFTNGTVNLKVKRMMLDLPFTNDPILNFRVLQATSTQYSLNNLKKKQVLIWNVLLLSYKSKPHESDKKFPNFFNRGSSEFFGMERLLYTVSNQFGQSRTDSWFTYHWHRPTSSSGTILSASNGDVLSAHMVSTYFGGFYINRHRNRFTSRFSSSSIWVSTITFDWSKQFSPDRRDSIQNFMESCPGSDAKRSDFRFRHSH